MSVKQNGLALTVQFKGYGDCSSADGHGSPILIENRDGKPFLVVWGDINREEPTHVIDLSGAAENLRKEL